MLDFYYVFSNRDIPSSETSSKRPSSCFDTSSSTSPLTSGPYAIVQIVKDPCGTPRATLVTSDVSRNEKYSSASQKTRMSTSVRSKEIKEEIAKKRDVLTAADAEVVDAKYAKVEKGGEKRDMSVANHSKSTALKQEKPESEKLPVASPMSDIKIKRLDDAGKENVSKLSTSPVIGHATSTSPVVSNEKKSSLSAAPDQSSETKHIRTDINKYRTQTPSLTSTTKTTRVIGMNVEKYRMTTTSSQRCDANAKGGSSVVDKNQRQTSSQPKEVKSTKLFNTDIKKYKTNTQSQDSGAKATNIVNPDADKCLKTTAVPVTDAKTTKVSEDIHKRSSKETLVCASESVSNRVDSEADKVSKPSSAIATPERSPKLLTATKEAHALLSSKNQDYSKAKTSKSCPVLSLSTPINDEITTVDLNATETPPVKQYDMSSNMSRNKVSGAMTEKTGALKEDPKPSQKSSVPVSYNQQAVKELKQDLSKHVQKTVPGDDRMHNCNDNNRNVFDNAKEKTKDCSNKIESGQSGHDLSKDDVDKEFDSVLASVKADVEYLESRSRKSSMTSDQPDLVCDLPAPVGGETLVEPVAPLKKSRSPVLTSADTFAKSGQSTLKKGHVDRLSILSQSTPDSLERTSEMSTSNIPTSLSDHTDLATASLPKRSSRSDVGKLIRSQSLSTELLAEGTSDISRTLSNLEIEIGMIPDLSLPLESSSKTSSPKRSPLVMRRTQSDKYSKPAVLAEMDLKSSDV